VTRTHTTSNIAKKRLYSALQKTNESSKSNKMPITSVATNTISHSMLWAEQERVDSEKTGESRSHCSTVFFVTIETQGLINRSSSQKELASRNETMLIRFLQKKPAEFARKAQVSSGLVVEPIGNTFEKSKG